MPSPDGAPASTNAGVTDLSATQLHALFDILTHAQTYLEIERFKQPETIAQYGYPFGTKTSSGELSYSSVSSAPLLASVFRPIVLPIPGVRDFPPDFWSVRFQGILASLGESNLSESYDKGALGTRKTLATAASVIYEAVARGTLGRVSRGESRNLHGQYDSSKAGDTIRAWDDSVHELVYGSLLDELFDYAAEKENLEEHSAAVHLAVDYVIIHMASFMHHILVTSAEGPYLLKLAENVHRLVPYSMMKQTLRIGNAATMLNGMLKLFLAKVSVGAVSNWLGLTQNADDGMNLLQRIISLVLSWDSSEFRKSAESIDKAKGGPSAEHLAALRKFVARSREDRDRVRKTSMEQKMSIVAAIFADADLPVSSLSEEQHTKCLEYYSALLSVRDRDEITKAICSQNPDIFSQAVRDTANSFEPIIRAIHERVDLREPFSAAESFLDDLIRTTKGSKDGASGFWKKSGAEGATAPSVEDYVGLLRRNRHALYAWLHQVASKCPDIADQFRAWVKDTVGVFQSQAAGEALAPAAAARGEHKDADSPGKGGHHKDAAGDMSGNLLQLFAALPRDKRDNILPALDAHAGYLSTLEGISTKHMQQVLDHLKVAQSEDANTKSKPPSSMSGPGMFLSRWQSLLDATVITPGPNGGPPRCGRDVKGSTSKGKTGVASAASGKDVTEEVQRNEEPSPPDVQVVVTALRPAFEQLVVDKTRV